MREPVIHAETAAWALVHKPHDMPTAPLVADEEGTLLSWFLNKVPDAAHVIGRKPIEHGLVHRLDTSTQGLVLIAKTTQAYIFFNELQQEGHISKRYYAFCAGKSNIITNMTVKLQDEFPKKIASQFRAFGPGRREVRPIFPQDRQFEDGGKMYTTTIENVVQNNVDLIPSTDFSCSLTRGYRHQVRVHLASLGYPIIGDQIYNAQTYSTPLQLYAFGISFIDPDSLLPVSFSLQQPNKMNQ